NDADVLAGSGNNFGFTDSNALAVGSVAGVSGVTAVKAVQLTTLGAAGTLTLNRGLTSQTLGIALRAGGAVTQAAGAGAALSAALALDVQGGGAVTLTNPFNSVPILAAQTTGPFAYTNAGALAIVSNSFANDGLGGSGSALQTTNAPITVATVSGDLTV